MRLDGRETHLRPPVAAPPEDEGHPETRPLTALEATAHHGLKVPRQMVAVGRDTAAAPGAGPASGPSLAQPPGVGR